MDISGIHVLEPSVSLDIPGKDDVVRMEHTVCMLLDTLHTYVT